MKTKKTKAYIFYGVILLITLAIVVILRSGVIENLFKDRIAGFITKETGINVSIGRIDISVLSSSVTLSSLVLQGNKAYRANIGKLTIVFEPPSILKKKPRLKTVYVNNATVSLTINEKLPGKVHEKSLTPALGTIERSLPVIVDHFIVNNTSLSLSMPTYNTSVAAAGVSMDVYPELNKKGAKGVIDIKGLALSRGGSAFTVSEAQFRGALNNNDIEISSLRLMSGSMNLVLSGQVRNYDNPDIDVRVKASARDVEQFSPFLKTLPVSVPEISGSYTFNGTITGDLLNPSSAGDIGFQDMIIGGVRCGTGSIAYTFKSQKLDIKAGDVNIANGKIKFSGTVDLSDNSLPSDFSVDLENISFGELLHALTVPQPYVDADITGKIMVKGTFNPVYFSGNLDTEFVKFSVYDDFFRNKKKHTVMVVKPVDIKSDLILTDRCAYITQTTVESARSVIHAYTALYFTGAMFLTFDSEKMDMRDVSPIANISYTGIGGTRGYIAGPFTDIVIHGDVSFHDYSMENIKTGNVTGGITFKGDTLSLESVMAARGESKLYINGGIKFSTDVELHMNVRFAPVELADIADNIGDKFIPLKGPAVYGGIKSRFLEERERSKAAQLLTGVTTGGYVTGSARIDGPAGRMNGFIALALEEPDFYLQSFDKGSLKITMDNGIFHINRAVFTKENSSLYAGGYISEDGSMDITFHTDGFSTDNVNILAKSNVPVRASLSFSGALEGRVDDPAGGMSLKLQDITYGRNRIPDCSAFLYFSNSTLSADAKLFDGAVHVNGHLGIEGQYPFELKAGFDKFDARPVLSSLSGIPLTSDVTGKLWLVGKLKDVPDSIVGYLYLDNLVFGNQSAVFRNSRPLFMDIARDNVYFRDFLLKGKNSVIGLKGFFGLKGNIDTFIDADVDLSYLPVFTNVIAGSNGTLKLDTRIFGEEKNVVVNGNAELNGDATFSELPVTLSGVHLSVIMANNSITIKDLSGNINSGTMSGSGRIITSGLLPRLFDLALSFKDVNFVYNNTIPMKLEGEMGLKGDYPQPVIEGTVKVVSAAYTDYINWEDQMLKFQHRRYEPKSVEQKKAHPLKLNIGVSAGNSIVIDNNIINSILSADLRIMGDTDNPVIVGNISTGEGRIYYRSTTFNIDNAMVTYTYEHPHNPFVDLRASTTQQFMVNNEYTEYRIYLTIAGELDKLNISLTSNPPNLDEMDIISLLTYGVTPAELMKSGISSAAAYEVGAAVGSKLAKDIFSELVGNENVSTFRKYFWVDNLQVEPYYPLGAPTTSIRLTVTKRLTNDFNVQYSYDLSGYNLQRFQGEYRLSKRLYLMGNWDNSVSQVQPNASNSNNVGNLGGDLKYKFEF